MLQGAVLNRETLRQLIANPAPGRPPLVEDMVSLEEQLQPCGLDLTLNRVDAMTSAGRLGRQPDDRVLPDYVTREFDSDGWLHLPPGPYLVTLNEIVNVPMDMMALASPRSTLGRSGISAHTSVWDPGYRGRSQVLLTVHNRDGFDVQRDARLIQLVWFRLVNPTGEGYRGRYQGEMP